MSRLPQPGGDNGNWGTVLNDYLSQVLKSDGTLKDNAVTSTTIADNAITAASITDGSITNAQIADGTIQEPKLSSAVQVKLNATAGTPDWTTIVNKPAVIAAGADQAAARTAIGAGTSDLAIGVTSTTAKAGDYAPTKADVGLSSVDNTSDASKNSAVVTLTNKTINGASNTLSNISESAVTNLTSDLSGKAATVHTHTATDISNSTAIGRSVLTAADASAVRTSIGAGTSNLVIGTSGSTAKAGDYVPTKADLGLSSVDDTADLAKPISAAQQTAFTAKADLVGGLVPTAQIPSLAYTTTVTVASQAAMLALTTSQVQPGDIAVRTDGAGSFILTAADPSQLSNWTLLDSPTAPVTSVNSQTGTIVLGRADIGLGNVDNTSDTNKPISSATQTTLNAKADLVGGLVPSSQLPAISLNTVVTVANQAAMLALSAAQVQPGDIAVRTDGAGSFILTSADPSVLSNWTLLNAPSDLVASVNSQTGTVVLGKADVGLGNVDNTSDASKPVSTATQTALSGKAATVHTHTAANISDSTATGRSVLTAVDDTAARTAIGAGISNLVIGTSNSTAKAGDYAPTKADVGLGNADNTADLSKPISTAQQTVFDAKADLVGGLVPTAQIPSLALNTAVTVVSQAAMLALTSTQVQPGDVAVRTDGAGTFILTSADPSQLANWTLLDAPTNVVTSVNGQMGTVVLGGADVGLANVDNTSDSNKPISSATQTAFNTKADLVGGLVPTSQIPSLSLTTTFTVVSQAAMLALTAIQVQPGDVAVRTDGAGTFILAAIDPSVLANWILLNAPTDVVNSVNGQTGTVVLDKSDVGLANVDNTSDANKPVSTATQTALDDVAASVHDPAAADISDSTATGRSLLTAADAAAARTVIGAGTSNLAIGLTSTTAKAGDYVPTKSDVGLGNVNNTADLSKPISTAQQTALDDKADLVGGLVPTAQIPSLALTTAVTAASQAAMLALTSTQVQPGDVAVRTDGAGTFILTDTDPSQLANWTLLNAPTDVVTSVNGQTSTVVLGKTDVGLGNVDNTSDINKPTSSATQTALDAKADLVGGFVPTAQIPTLALTAAVTAASQAAMLALTSTQVQPGDLAIRTDGAGTFILTAVDPSQLANWKLLSAPTDVVTSVNSQTGLVVLGKSDVGLGSVDNTSDATKNTAAVTLTNKTLTSPVITTPTGIVKGDVGLGSVDNTSDVNKPVSTAQAAAIAINSSKGFAIAMAAAL